VPTASRSWAFRTNVQRSKAARKTALVLERLVDAGRGNLHGVGRVADRGGVATAFPENADGFVQRFAHVELEPPTAGRGSGMGLWRVARGSSSRTLQGTIIPEAGSPPSPGPI
jgi:hypothetical protein